MVDGRGTASAISAAETAQHEHRRKGAGSQRRPRRTDFDRFRLRRFVESLPDGELETRDEPLDLADVAPMLEGNPRAVLFRAVGPGAAGTRRQRHRRPHAARARLRRRAARAAGRDPAPAAQQAGDRRGAARARRRCSRSCSPATRPTSPRCRCISATAPTAGPTSRPRSISSSTRKTGWTNVGMRRLMLRGRRETGIDLVSPSDLRAIYEASAAAGKPLPVSFVVGAHPIDHVAAMMRLPVDELGLRRVAARRAAAGGEMRHQRHPRAGRRRMGARGLSRRARPRRAGRALRRVPRLLRRAQAQSGVPPHRDHAAARRAVPDLDHRRPRRSAAPTPRSSTRCAPR